VLARRVAVPGSLAAMAEQVPAVGRVLAAIERRDWAALAGLLDSGVHWTTVVEEHLHGPEAVIERLAHDPSPAPPAYHELRDGRVVRWIDTPG
jgi:hypothetical protein